MTRLQNDQSDVDNWLRIYLRAGLGNGTKVIDHVGLGHADTTIADGEELIFFVWDYADEELLFRLEDGGISE